MSSKPDFKPVLSEATFSLVSCICHFDTSTNGTIDTIRDASAVFHQRLELPSTYEARATVIMNNIKHLEQLQQIVMAEKHRQSKLLLRL